ncbi:MAG: hypothetical protein E6523_09965, partial [Streptococcus sp.]|nr:hypothetical protein [Streptococcus sp.]
KPQSNSQSGVRGVVTYKQAGKLKYRAVLTVNGTVYQKAGFKTIEEAAEYRKYLVQKYLPKD